MNYELVRYFENINRNAPEPDPKFTLNTLVLDLGKAIMRSAEATFLCLIAAVDEAKTLGKLDYDTKRWIWNNYRVAINNQFKGILRLCVDNPDLFRKVCHLSQCEGILAWFTWCFYDRSEINQKAIRLILKYVDQSELGEIQYPIEHKRFYRMYHYLIDTFGFDVIREGTEPETSAEFLESIYSYMKRSGFTIAAHKTESKWISDIFKNSTHEWLHSFISNVYLNKEYLNM